MELYLEVTKHELWKEKVPPGVAHTTRRDIKMPCDFEALRRRPVTEAHSQGTLESNNRDSVGKKIFVFFKIFF